VKNWRFDSFCKPANTNVNPRKALRGKRTQTGTLSVLALATRAEVGRESGRTRGTVCGFPVSASISYLVTTITVLRTETKATPFTRFVAPPFMCGPRPFGDPRYAGCQVLSFH